MRKAAVCVALLFLAAVLPSLTFTEDQETVWLARAVYAVARDESYETKLAVACAALNRVESPWHPNTLKGVLAEKHQFRQAITTTGQFARRARGPGPETARCRQT